MKTMPTFPKILFWLASACFTTGATVSAQSTYEAYLFSTFAGNAGYGSADGTGSAARFTNPTGMAVDGAGNKYVADTNNHTIRKITSAGVVTTLAGQAGTSGTADGTGSAARFNLPKGVAVDSAGNVYVADTNNSTIRKITPAGVVSTLAGAAGVIGFDDGIGSAARFYKPAGVSVDSAGNVYVADTNNYTIRKITPAAVVTTFAGTAFSNGSNDGTGANARFWNPSGVTVDSGGNIYVADTSNQAIRKITPAAVVTTIAGQSHTIGSADGTGAAATFFNPTAVAVDSSGNLYVADFANSTIRKITPAAVVSTFAGLAQNYGYADGTGNAARFDRPSGVTVDSAGTVYVADVSNAIRQITPAAVVSTFAGLPGGAGSADGTGSAARFGGPASVTVDSAGNVYVADTGNQTIRKITPAGGVTTLAGQAGAGGFADGTGSAARFLSPTGVAVDRAGNVYVADSGNSNIRKITPAGVVTTLAGQPGNLGSADGIGAAASFNRPTGIAVDSTGDATFRDSLFVADSGNNTIRKVTLAGEVTTFAGQAGTVGSTDGTGSAARFSNPMGVIADTAGNVYVGDTSNHTIRKITPAGVVTTLAGQANASGSADATGTAAKFNLPTGVAVDSAGNVYVADRNNSTIRKITPAGVVTTLGGLAGTSGSIEGTGSGARFNSPRGVALDSAGHVYVADTSNHTIRKGVPAVPPAITSANSATFKLGSSSTFTITSTGTPAAVLSETGTPPSGVTFVDNGDGTATIAGTPASGSAGTYALTITAANGAPPDATQTFTLTVPKFSQAITFGSLAGKTYGDPDFTVSASASSGLPVTFSIVSGPATITGNTVHLTGAGTVTVRATQSGNIDYAATPSVDQSFTVAKRTQPLNISTRMEVLAGDNVLIAGFIITGDAGATKKVMIRGLGPSLGKAGVPNALVDPLLELHGPAGFSTIVNDNWADASNVNEIPAGFQPSDSRESVIIATLTIGSSGFASYTAIVRGANGQTGVGLAEAYDLDTATTQFANISTRGFIDSGDNVMIGGFILGGSNAGTKVMIRALGPSLADQGVAGVLADPTLEIHDSNGGKIKSNDNWKIDDATGQSQQATIEATTIPPNKDLESAIVDTFPPGAYTAIVAGKSGGVGVGLVEVYNLR